MGFSIGKFMGVGAVEGFGRGLEQVGRQWSAQQHATALSEASALRERSLAELRGEIEGKSQQRGFEHSEVMERGRQTFQAEQNAAQRTSAEGIHAADRASRDQKPQELLDYYKANANRLNAEARAIEQGLKYGQKPALPNIKVEKDADGQIYNVDTTSGAIGVIQPGQPAVKGETRWLGPNDPDKPATAPNINWSLNGKPLPGGLGDLYPAIKSRVGDQPGGGGSASGVDWAQFTGGGAAGQRGPTADPLGLRGNLPGRPQLGAQAPQQPGPQGGTRQPTSQSGSTTAPASSRSLTRVMPELVTASAGRSSPKERHQASMSKLRAENEAHYSQRIADTFRSILETGSYKKEDRDFLEFAIERGALTASEKQIATKMLEAIGEAEFSSGYEGAR